MAGGDDGLHEALDVGQISGGGEPLVLLGDQGLGSDQVAGGGEGIFRVFADFAVKAVAWEGEGGGEFVVGEGFVPAVEGALAVLDVVEAEDFVEGVADGDGFGCEVAGGVGSEDGDGLVEGLVFGVFGFVEAALEGRCKKVCGIGRDFSAEEVKAIRIPLINITLDNF